jgi:uncharacterized membrane protein YcfT
MLIRVLVGIYIAVQAVLMTLMCLSNNYDDIYKVFRIQLLVFNIIFILDVNVSMYFVHRSHAGQPFKS